MSVRISTPRMTTEPSIRLWEERIFGLINSLTGLLTVLMAPRPSRELPPPQVPANWAVLRILAQSPFLRRSGSSAPLAKRPLPRSAAALGQGESRSCHGGQGPAGTRRQESFQESRCKERAITYLTYHEFTECQVCYCQKQG